MDINGLGNMVLHNDGLFKQLSANGMTFPSNDTLLTGHNTFEKV